jgi:3-oxoacyl-[acyl-carrier-protein] synthase II
MIGHPLGASGVVAGAACILAIQHQFVPPTVNLMRPAPGCDLDYVLGRARPRPVQVALAFSWGWGGNNVAIVYGKHEPQRRASPQGGRVERRVVITGMGIISCVGIGKEEFWEAMAGGRHGLVPIKSFDAAPYGCEVAGEVQDARLAPYVSPARLRRLDTVSLYAVASTRMAVLDAGLQGTKVDRERVGVMVGTSTGPLGTISAFQRKMLLERTPVVNPMLFSNTVFSAAAGHVCVEHGFKGYTATLAIGDVSGLSALAYGYDLLKRGAMDAVVVVSASEFNETLLAGCSRLGLLSKGCCRPFDGHRDGGTLSAGATAFILETADHAVARGARVYGEIKGYGITADAQGLGPMPFVNGRGGGPGRSVAHWARAITAALESSETRAEAIGHVAAAACGAPVADLAETRALKAALAGRAYEIPVNAMRSMVGYAGSSGATLALAASLIGMSEGVIPPTVNLDTPDGECDLFYVPHRSVKARVDSFLVNAVGCGGTYVSLVCGRWNG